MFKESSMVQEHVNIIHGEGRTDDLIKICDYYHHRFDSVEEALRWGIDFGEHVGKYFYGDNVWRFFLRGSETMIYFIGTEKTVRIKVLKIL